eukprot:TRINITY_DN2656_c0_g1_i2.p1 TRINITY_DN2656_c0_g1~~TRINITY_DN2656_c0_g1_i2.p1  ORF type:complete len:495 (-),score=70.59 TRINITY_DN2656_c0_g1_i2:191-1675(-)
MKGRQVLDYVLVLDIEATCEKDDRNYYNEIIEFPVILINLKTEKIEAEFHRFVRPTVIPKLTEFCKDLTGITQELVECSPSFSEVLDEFKDWLIKHQLINENRGKVDHLSNVNTRNFCFATDGIWDIRKFMAIEFSKLSRNDPRVVLLQPFFERWINVRRLFSKEYQCAQLGIAGMLSKMDLTFEGRPHSGILDARNLSTVLLKMVKDNTVLYPNEVGIFGELYGASPLPSPKRDEILVNITQEIKRINKYLQHDKRFSPFSSHNKSQVYQLSGYIPDIKAVLRTIHEDPSSPNTRYYRASSDFSTYRNNSPSAKITLQTSNNKAKLQLDPRGLTVVEDIEYEDNPFRDGETELIDGIYHFKRMAFIGSLLHIKLALLTLEGGDGEVSITLYTKKGELLVIDVAEVRRRNLEWVDVSLKHKPTSHRKSPCALGMFTTELLEIPQSGDESSWKQWRSSILQKRKHLQKLKIKRKKQLRKMNLGYPLNYVTHATTY